MENEEVDREAARSPNLQVKQLSSILAIIGASTRRNLKQYTEDFSIAYLSRLHFSDLSPCVLRGSQTSYV